MAFGKFGASHSWLGRVGSPNAPSGGNIAFAAAPTSTGNQDITAANLTQTPKAALLFIQANTSLDAAQGNIGFYGMGATDGTNQWAAGGWRDGATSASRANTTSCVLLCDNAGTVGQASFVSFIPGGIRINWTTALPSAYRMMAVFFYGASLQVAVGVQTTPSTSGTTVTTGFRPSVVFVGTNNATIDNSLRTGWLMTFGASDGTNQRSTSRYSVASNNKAQHFASVTGSEVGPTPNVAYTIAVDTFAASSFKMTASAAAGSSDDFGWLALNYGGASQVSVGTWAMPTSSGSASKTGLAFQPDLVIGHYFSGQSSGSPTATGAEFGVFAFNSTTCGGLQNWSGTGAAGTTILRASATKLARTNNSPTLLDEATFTSLNSDGWTFNFTTADSTARDWWYVAMRF